MKVLALDGGGVFGKIQSRIVKQSGCVDCFDAFVGTSIGGALSLGYALGDWDAVSPKFFDKWMPKVFEGNWFRKNLNLFVPKYSDKGLNAALKAAFGGSVTLGDCKKPCFVTAAKIGTRTLKVFSSLDGSDSFMRVWEVARIATAAETYFSPWVGYMDGGIFANNPSMVAVAALSRAMGIPIGEIEIFSIGTGKASYSNLVPHGRITTALWVLRAMLDGASDTMHEYFVRSLPVKNFKRVQFTQEPDWEMDNVLDMNRAEIAWCSEIDEAAKSLREFCGFPREKSGEK